MGRRRKLAGALAVIVGLAGVGAGTASTLALLTSQPGVNGNVLSAARIFSGERSTPVFAVTDVSSGSAVDVSSSDAFASDGRYFLTRPWTSAFDSSRWLELDLNGPLPTGLSVTSPALTIALASNAAGATACYYIELRTASGGSVLSSHGSSGSPLDCVTGTTPASKTVSLSAITTTSIADDLRVRIYARDSGASSIRLDALTIAGSSPYASFNLFPTLTRETYSGNTELIKWALTGP